MLDMPKFMGQMIISEVFDRFPRLRVILDHLGRPVQEDGPPYAAADSLWGLAKYPHVYLKVTERNLEGASKGKATPEAAMAPATNWPSAPMFQTLDRKHTDKPKAINNRGVALMPNSPQA